MNIQDRDVHKKTTKLYSLASVPGSLRYNLLQDSKFTTTELLNMDVRLLF